MSFLHSRVNCNVRLKLIAQQRQSTRKRVAKQKCRLARSSPHAEKQSMSSICSAELDSGSGNIGGNGGVPPRWTVGEDEPIFGEGPFSEAEQILAKRNVDPATLPADIQEAVQRGAASAADIELYLKIASTPILGWVCKMLPFIRERVMGNPRFLLVLAIEEVIGGSAKMAAEVQGRGDEFWNGRSDKVGKFSRAARLVLLLVELAELHFVASDIALELIGDFAVVCLLSPKKSFLQRPKPGFSRVIAGLPGHAFQLILQKGNYSLPQRLSTVLYRGAQFFTVGFVSSGLGHSLTKWAVEKKQAANPKQEGDEPYKPLAPVLENSVMWGGFMAVSTNLRYQMMNGIEERCLDVLIRSTALKTGISSIMRFGNTFAGGAQWVWYARLLGLQ